MKLLNQRTNELCLIFVTSLFVTTCASDPVKVNLPANHPANPQSQETAFNPPPNPFQNNIPRVEHEGDGSSSMTHERHQPAHQHQMSPKIGHDSMPSQGSEEQNSEHQHKEHSQ
jgi:hypothetical protein